MEPQDRGLQPHRARHARTLSGPARARRAGRVAAALGFFLACSGCAGYLARTVAEPPRAPVWKVDERDPLELLQLRREFLERTDAPRIAYLVLEPNDYGFWYEYRADAFRWNARLGFAAQPGPPMAPRGTVLMLHGWSLDALANLHWAVALAERGYRAVLMDLRNHGESGDAPAGLGSREADDVLALIAELRRQGRVQSPLALLGVSLGAVTAIEAAARGGDVDAVLALEPFANGADAVQSAGTGLARLMTMRAVTEKLATPDRLERVVDELSHRLELDVRSLRVADALAEVDACVAIVHGQRDRLIPVESTRALGAGQANVSRLELPWDGHFSTPARLDLLADPVARWIEAIGLGACGPLRVYPFAPTNGVRNVLVRPGA